MQMTFTNELSEILKELFSIEGTISMMISTMISLTVSAYLIFIMWRIFSKAGEAGWKALIPFYNTWIFHKIVWGKGYYMFFLWIPIYNIIFSFKTCTRLSKAFGKSLGFGVGLFFFPEIFESIIAFDKSTYVGPQDW